MNLDQQYLSTGILYSSLGHALIFILAFFGLGPGVGKITPPTTYSVTLESGEKKGGVSQVPDLKQKTELAPPKNVKKTPPPTKDTDKAEVKIEDKTPDKPKKEEPPKAPEVEKEPPKTPPKKDPPKKKELPPAPKKKAPTAADVNKDYQAAIQRYLGESTSAGGRGFGSAGRDGQGMGGGNLRSPEWFLYKNELETFVKRGWNWHDSTADLITTVIFSISTTGVVSDIQLVSSSGDPKYDDSVIRAIRKASPVPPAPPNLYADFKRIRMHFRPE